MNKSPQNDKKRHKKFVEKWPLEQETGHVKLLMCISCGNSEIWAQFPYIHSELVFAHPSAGVMINFYNQLLAWHAYSIVFCLSTEPLRRFSWRSARLSDISAVPVLTLRYQSGLAASVSNRLPSNISWPHCDWNQQDTSAPLFIISEWAMDSFPFIAVTHGKKTRETKGAVQSQHHHPEGGTLARRSELIWEEDVKHSFKRSRSQRTKTFLITWMLLCWRSLEHGWFDWQEGRSPTATKIHLAASEPPWVGFSNMGSNYVTETMSMFYTIYGWINWTDKQI